MYQKYPNKTQSLLILREAYREVKAAGTKNVRATVKALDNKALTQLL